jgi:hypothetical protein
MSTSISDRRPRESMAQRPASVPRGLQHALRREAAADVKLALRVAVMLAAGARQHEVQRALGLNQHELRESWPWIWRDSTRLHAIPGNA